MYLEVSRRYTNRNSENFNGSLASNKKYNGESRRIIDSLTGFVPARIGTDENSISRKPAGLMDEKGHCAQR